MSTEAHEPNRLLFVDTLRGLAVIFMIQLHTSHGWLDPAVRQGDLWTATQFFGGLAAPAFLMLAGISLGVQWGRAAILGRPLRFQHQLARGLQLLVLGYALRLQMWVVDSGAYARLKSYFPILCLVAAYALAHHAASLLGKPGRRALTGFCAAAGLWVLGMGTVRIYEPERLRGLLRIDVLQCIGASLVLLNGLGAAYARWTRSQRPPPSWLLLGFSLATCLATPWLREHAQGALPDALAGYLAQWPAPDNKPVLALFPLFPWFSYAALGAIVGLYWARASTQPQLEQRAIMCVAVGAWLALVSSEAWHPAAELARTQLWFVPTLRVAYKCGLVLTLTGVALVVTRAPAVLQAPLHTLGRASLLVYWAHLEFAFGVAARPVVRSLDMQRWAFGTCLLIAAMWLLAHLRARGWPLKEGSRLQAPGSESRT